MTVSSTASEKEDDAPSSLPSRPAIHENHCFVVMPFGGTGEEQRWFRGWYEVVIEPAVVASGFVPILAAAEEQPGAINDEIRSHLVFDPMVVVDLGGVRKSEPPNPNVMYELGIRHAFGLPVVIMGWKDQRLPFDVSNQRAIMSERDLLDITPTRTKLEKFIRAAAEGRYYDPMEAVGRTAAIENSSLVLGEDSLLTALAREVEDLRHVIVRREHAALERSRRITRPRRVRTLLDKELKPRLWEVAKDHGLDGGGWGKLLNHQFEPEVAEEAGNWDFVDWSNTIEVLALQYKRYNNENIDQELIEQVFNLLPQQPWPKNTHKDIAEKLGMTPKLVSKAINELIKQGRAHHQVDGVVLMPTAVDS